MLDGKNSLSRKKKERENDILRRIYLAQLVLFIRKGGGGKERERRGKIAHCPTKNIHAE